MIDRADAALGRRVVADWLVVLMPRRLRRAGGCPLRAGRRTRYSVTASAILAAMSFSDPALVRPEREPSKGLTSRSLSNVVP